MDETYTTKAIILNQESFRENDSRVMVYSHDRGRLELVARGTKKILSKLAGQIEPVNLTEIMVIRGRAYDYIGGAVSQETYYNIKHDLAKLEAVGKALRFFNRLVKPELNDENIFKLLSDYLSELNSSRSNMDYELFLNFFIFLFLSTLGYQPQLFTCIKCKKKLSPMGNHFDYARGGLICDSCPKGNHSLTVGENCVKVLRFAVKSDLNKLIKLKISAQTKAEIIKTVSSFVKYNFS